MSELQLKAPSNKLIFGKTYFGSGVRRPSMLSAFALAGLVTGVNWFIQSNLAAAEKARQEQVIGRIASDKTVELNDLRNFQELDQYEGCKVKIRGELESSRFVVKRKKNNDDGYIVLAPFVVGKIVSNNDVTKSTLNQKFMLNVGWVPKQSKYRIRETLSPAVAGGVDFTEETQIDEQPLVLSNVTAYVRKGEKRDFFRGYRNWAQSQLFKFIDLDFLSDRYCNLYPSFKYIYLDRIQESENLMPFPEGNTKSDFIQQVREEIDYNNKVRNYFSWGVGVTSFCAAVVLTI